MTYGCCSKYPDDIISYCHISSGWPYVIQMKRLSYGWDTLNLLSQPDEIANFDFSQHAVALQRFRTSTPNKAIDGRRRNSYISGSWWRHKMKTFFALQHKGQWRGALIFSEISAWTNGRVNNRNAGDLRRHCANYDVTVMSFVKFTKKKSVGYWYP